MSTCPHCQRTEDQVKAGKTRSGSQRYKCKACQRVYTPRPKQQGYSDKIRRKAIRLYVDGMSLRAIGRHLGVGHKSVGHWIKAHVAQLPAPTVLIFKPEANLDRELQLQNGDINLSGEERGSDSLFVERVWRTRSDGGGSFISTAESHWEIVISKHRRSSILTVRGPETRATAAYCPPDTEFMGIVFKAGASCRNSPQAW